MLALSVALAGQVKEIVEERKARLDAATDIETRAKGENRPMNDEEQARVGELLGEIEQLGEVLEKRSKSDDLATHLEAARGKRFTDPIKGGTETRTEAAEPIHKDIGRYSLLRAIQCRMSERQLDGVEAEVHAEIERRSGKPAQGFYMPWEIALDQRSRPRNYETRTEIDTSQGTGAVGTVTSPNMIDILRNEMQVMRAGASVLTGMRGNFSIPKQSATGAAYWVAESTNITTESAQTIGSIAFAPSTVGCYSSWSRKFMLQTSVDAENFVRRDLAAVMALELDRVGLNGSGSGAEPEGVQQNSSVPSVAIGANGGAPTWGTFVDLETEITQDNASGANMAYITNAKVIGKTKQVEKASSTAQFIHDGSGINGYRALRSNQVPSNLTKGSGTNLSAALFGNWADLIYAFWGGLDVLVNPYANDLQGGVRITFLQDADVQVRHTEAFSKCVDIDTT